MTRLLWERWDEVDRLLSEALDLPVAERSEFISRELEAVGPFRDLVLRLVARLATDHGRVSRPVDPVVAAAFGAGDGSDAGSDLAIGDGGG